MIAQTSSPDNAPAPLVDGFGRTITYLRVSVTDRCDLRCRYCMAETMTFLPRAKLATLDELAMITERFIARGVRKVRLSGGEPLVRRDVIDLVETARAPRRRCARRTHDDDERHPA